MSGTLPTAGGAFSSAFGVPPDDFRLILYNSALRHCRKPRLAAIDEDIEARYLLDDAWNEGAAQTLLEKGLWYFAQRTSQMDADPTLTPNFGYSNAFTKPADWVRTMGAASDDRFNVPLTRIRDEAGYFFADLSTFYLSYVSNDPEYGGAYSRWPQSFFRAMGSYLAELVVGTMTTSQELIDAVKKQATKDLKEAKSIAAMNESAQFLPAGSWLRARRGNLGTSDRGNPNSLYG